MSGIIGAVLQRELLRAWRHSADVALALLFFILAVMLFPFALGTDPALLGATAAAAVWIATLLATTLSLDSLFRSDFEDGSLEQIALSGAPMPVVGLAKSMAHWLISALPIIVLAVPLALSLNLAPALLPVLLASLTLATVTMSLVGTAISALTVGLRGGGMLLALLILPMYIPLLVFGAAATANAALGQSAAAELYFLAGVLVLALTLAPWATGAALKIRLG